jgi:hypothetical protein
VLSGGGSDGSEVSYGMCLYGQRVYYFAPPPPNATHYHAQPQLAQGRNPHSCSWRRQVEVWVVHDIGRPTLSPCSHPSTTQSTFPS